LVIEMSALANTHSTATDNVRGFPVAGARRPEGTRPDRDRTHRQTLSYAALAFERIVHSRLPADPEIYEVWYEYMRGQMPALNQAIDAIIARDQPMTRDDLSQLRDQFFSSGRIIDSIDTVGQGVDCTIANVLTFLDAAAWSNDNFVASLAGASENLQQSADHSALVTIIETLAAATAEVEARNRDLSACLTSSMREIADLQKSLSAVRAESMTDALTTLANRKHFDKALDSAVAQYRSDGQAFSLLLCDVDHFKQFNDTFGHLTGDRVLTLVGTTLKQSVRGQDTPARYGGEEFAIILPGTLLRQALAVGENVRKAVSKCELVKRSTGESLGRVTISVGIAEIQDGDTAQSLIERADNCLYQAKRLGRDRTIAETGLVRE
jgi:diguanylate cyclase